MAEPSGADELRRRKAARLNRNTGAHQQVHVSECEDHLWRSTASLGEIMCKLGSFLHPAIAKNASKQVVGMLLHGPPEDRHA